MRPRLASRQFILVCAATLAFFTSLNMQPPVFPSFLRDRVGASTATIGLFIGLFSIVGVGMRPFVGRTLMHRSRRSFMILGGVITAISSAAYLGPRTMAFLVPVRLFHGIAIASYYTSASTLVADIAPVERRAEALSYFSMFLYVGLAGGGALGLALEEGPGFNAVFIASAAIGILCAAIASTIREPRAHSPEAVQTERHPLINRRALFPGLILIFSAVGYSSMLNFSADFARGTHIAGATLYFPVLAASVVIVRALGGVVSDRVGRFAVALPGLTLFAGGLLVQAGARSTPPLLIAAVAEGVGFGFFFPSMLAFTVDRVQPVERGSAMGTLTGAFDVGMGIGSYALGAIAGATSYPTMYRAAVGFVAFGIALLGYGAARMRAPSPLRTSGDAASASS